MPQRVMMAETGAKWKVVGRRRAMAAVGPKPGRTPTRVPIKHPKKQRKRLVGWKTMENPKIRE
jgi:hypothetical protein